MKKILLIVSLALCAAAIVFAQQGFTGQRGFWSSQAALPAAETVSVTGDLTIVEGSLAIKSGDTTYFVMGLNQYIGFIDSLKDGARVSLEGSSVDRDAVTKVLWVSKLSVGGKDYDLARPGYAMNRSMAPAFSNSGPRNRNMRSGHGCRDYGYNGQRHFRGGW